MRGEKSRQSELIGEHLGKEKMFNAWLQCDDFNESHRHIHRKLFESELNREKPIETVSKWFIKHHLSDKRIARIEEKKKVLEKHGFDLYIKNLGPLPTDEKTIRGNAAEIILTEYLKSISDLQLLVYRLHYNPNVNQSMKGDDVLLLDVEDPSSKIIIGESKFRKTPGQAVIKEIVDSMGKELTYPLSLLFVSQILSDMGKEELAEKIEEVNSELHTGKTNIINVGFLLSNHNTVQNVNRHLYSENENFVFISLGIEEPEKLLKEVYDLAVKNLEES